MLHVIPVKHGMVKWRPTKNEMVHTILATLQIGKM